MKKLFSFMTIAIIVFSVVMTVSCENGDNTENTSSTEAETETNVSAFESAPAIETSKAPETTETPTEAPAPITEKPHLEIPEDFFDTSSTNCSSISIPKEYNPGLYCDLNVIIDNQAKTVTIYLPCSADREQFVFALRNSDGSIKKYVALDISNGGENAEKSIKINKQTYDFIIYQSDSPSLILNIDEDYGTISAMQNDSSHTVKAFGDAVITSTKDKAMKYDWDTFYKSIENDPDSPCTVSIKGRGNVSWTSTKKSYLVKFEKKINVLGMGSAKRWCLVPCMNDISMLRNQLAYMLGSKIGLLTPDYVLTDFFLNGAYKGTYLLIEKVEIGVNRIDIDSLEDAIDELSDGSDPVKYAQEKLDNGIVFKYWKGVPDPEDITGGYVIEMDLPRREMTDSKDHSWFTTSRGHMFTTSSPTYCSKNQMLYISNFVQELEDAMYSSDGINPKTGKHFTEYIDIDSYILRYWLDEIMRNTDTNVTSVFFYKPSDNQDNKLYCGPAWDYDNTLSGTAEKWFASNPSNTNTGDGLGRDYHIQLCTHKVFQDRVMEIFTDTVYPAVYSLVRDGIYDEMFEDSRDSIILNYTIVGSEDYDAVYSNYINFISKRTEYFKKHLAEHFVGFKR